MALTTSTLVGEYLQTTFDGSSTPTDTVIDNWISWAEAEIERRTGQKWESTTVSSLVIDLDRYNSFQLQDALLPRTRDFFNPRVDAVFIGVRRIQLHPKYVPLISITSLERNTAGEIEADSWESLTEQSGSGGDYFTDLNSGVIDFLRNTPRFGKRAVRITFDHGRSSVPKEVEKLATLMVAREVLDSSFFTNQNGNWDSVSVADISLSKANNTPSIKTVESALDRQWQVVGEFFTQIV